MNNRTIIALATPKLNSAIGLIRLSGKQTYEIANKLFNKQIEKKANTFSLETIVNQNNEVIDQVIVLKYVEPRSYTGFDMIEICCHGGVVVIDQIIALAIEYGASYAEPGEFSKQAFLNNKSSFSQLNSVNNLIFAKTPNQAKIAAHGVVKNKFDYWNEIEFNLFKLLGKIEINIDYPEYETEEVITLKDIDKLMNQLEIDLNKFVNDYSNNKQLIEGINLTVIGKPNVGKSSLVNALIQNDEIIVSNIAGTTRDLIRKQWIYKGIVFSLIDSAGIRQSGSKLEKLGIAKSLNAIKNADLVLFVIDTSKKLSSFEKDLFNKIKKNQLVLIKNKADLKDVNQNINGISISAKKKQLANLYKYFDDLLERSNEFNLNQTNVVMSQNEILIIKDLLKDIKQTKKAVRDELSIDLISILLKNLLNKIHALLGKNNEFDLVNKMFDHFCLGK